MTKLANTKSVNRWYINSGVNYVRNTYGQINCQKMAAAALGELTGFIF